MEIFAQKIRSVENQHKCIQLNILIFFVTYRKSFHKNTGNKNSIVVNEDLSFSQHLMSSPLVFDSLKNKYYFPPVNDSNSFGTVD